MTPEYINQIRSDQAAANRRASMFEIAIAKAVDDRSTYGMSIFDRLDQMVQRYDDMRDQIDRLKTREKRLAEYLDRAVNGVLRETDLEEARALLEEVLP